MSVSTTSSSSHNATAPTITCRAAVIWREYEGPKVEEIQVEAPKSGEVRVKMLFASICHTDVLGCRGFPTPVFPRVLGHEGLGMVESIGEGVKHLKCGDIVIPTYLGECGDCENCRSGKTNLCQTYPLQAFTGLMPGDTTPRMFVRGQPLYHFLSCSTWSQYTVVHANYCVNIDSRMPLHHASFLSCGFTTGFGSVWKEAKVHRGSTVAVLGLGAVGLGVIEGARLHGAARIIGIDINESKRTVGEAFGMTDFINPTRTNDDDNDNNNNNSSISELVKQLTGGNGVDYSFECTGVPQLVNEALEATKVGIGRMTMLGAATEKSVEIDFVTLLGCRTFKYAVFGGVKVQSDLPLVIHKCINKEIQNLDKLLTHQLSLEDINKGFQLLKEPQCVKVIEGARLHGTARIIGIDINEIKRTVGEAFGMTDFINPTHTNDDDNNNNNTKSSISEMVKQLMGGIGVDYSFECTGVPQLVNEALEATSVGIDRMTMLGAATEKSV